MHRAERGVPRQQGLPLFRIISRRAQKRREAWGFIIADDALGSGGLSGPKAWDFSIADGSGGLKGREFREKRKRGVAYFLPSSDYWHLHLYHLYLAVIRIRSTHPLHYTVALDGGSEARYDICVAKGRGLWFCRRAARGHAWPRDGMPGLATVCLALRRYAWPRPNT